MTQDYSNPSRDPDQDRVSLQKLQSLNTIGTISYILHLIVAIGALIPGGQFGPALLIVALVIDLAKRSDAEGTWHASHFRWRIRTVIIAALLYLVTAPLWLILLIPGWIAWLVISAWFLYRIVTGMVRMNKGLPMEFPA
ncbi:MAG: hypothetical protein KJ614_14720 [Gammaproteobacteria bacterium]|uniref:DUF4870 family protein n=1 Tax=Rhodoferax sp. TaxID=50421 RepID=UPI00181DBFAA|nr:hypothetical protein [Rhodoferax sp.]MBU3900153.1 hypothetical protein [Gammaproteobacteria bacterium]MBA3058713.1 hypothetical protein [Rhodoferax sp.]MBU3996689.1 hypothetical protein [Gammaproteobacteria bacterium]MBU4018337.1 hypothetical protein [Gammaproteobacteria bacterium]MBU4082191.1 hypothetical protein [Gammaproteobacteria bacterium]